MLIMGLVWLTMFAQLYHLSSDRMSQSEIRKKIEIRLIYVFSHFTLWHILWDGRRKSTVKSQTGKRHEIARPIWGYLLRSWGYGWMNGVLFLCERSRHDKCEISHTPWSPVDNLRELSKNLKPLEEVTPFMMSFVVFQARRLTKYVFSLFSEFLVGLNPSHISINFKLSICSVQF